MRFLSSVFRVGVGRHDRLRVSSPPARQRWPHGHHARLLQNTNRKGRKGGGRRGNGPSAMETRVRKFSDFRFASALHVGRTNYGDLRHQWEVSIRSGPPGPRSSRSARARLAACFSAAL